jgi:hypothetical protein
MTSASEAIVDLAMNMRRLGQSGLLQSCDLEVICGSLGVTVRREPLVRVHGSLVRGSQGFVAYLNSRDSVRRQRFTLAHELGHLAMEAERAMSIYHRGGPSEARESGLERRCDEFATELLMPAAGVAAIFRTARPSVEQVLNLADRYEVSVESAAMRVGELTEMPCQIVKWLPQETKFSCQWERGEPKAVRRGQSVSGLEFGVGEAFQSEGIVLHHDTESRGFGSNARRYVLSVILQEAASRMSRRRESHGRPRH